MYQFAKGEDKAKTVEFLPTSGIDSTGINDFHFSKIQVHGDNCQKIRDRILELLEKYGIED